MKSLTLLAFAVASFGPLVGNFAHAAGRPNLATVQNAEAWRLANATAETMEMEGKSVVRLTAQGDSANRIAGLALPVGAEFATGTIEVDLKGTSTKQRSFLGVVFNAIDDRTFEGIYFRPFNFKATDPVNRRAVQYIAWPENTWEKLRKDRPGQFENRVDPVPNPDGWFHARIEVTENRVMVFVDGAQEPSLSIDRLAHSTAKRPVGLFVDVADGLYANLQITPDK